MMAVPTSESEFKGIIEALRKSDERVPREILDLLEKPLSHNDENGFRKWCAACGSDTGHLIVPTRAWQIERCMRCGMKTRYACLRPGRGSGHRLLLVKPGLTKHDVVMHRLQVYGLGHELWALDRYIDQKAKENVKAILAKRLEARQEERRKLARLGTL